MFRQECEAELSKLKGERFGFEYLKECVINVLAAEDLPRDRMTTATLRMHTILDNERARIRRIKRWNRERAGS